IVASSPLRSGGAEATPLRHEPCVDPQERGLADYEDGAGGGTSCDVMALMSSITARRSMPRNIASAARLAAPAAIDGVVPSAESASRTTSAGSMTPCRSPLAGWLDCHPGVRVEPGRIAT